MDSAKHAILSSENTSRLVSFTATCRHDCPRVIRGGENWSGGRELKKNMELAGGYERCF